jgi:hypothetical protein
MVIRTIPYAMGAMSGAAVCAGVDLAATATGTAAGIATGITTAVLRETTRAVAGDGAAIAVSSALNTGVFIAGSVAHTTARVAGAAAGALTAFAVTGVGNAVVTCAIGSAPTASATQALVGDEQDGTGQRWGAASALWDDIPPSPNQLSPNQGAPHCTHTLLEDTTSPQPGHQTSSDQQLAASEGMLCGVSAPPSPEGGACLYPAVPEVPSDTPQPAAADASCLLPQSQAQEASAGFSPTSPSTASSAHLHETQDGFIWVPSPPKALQVPTL